MIRSAAAALVATALLLAALLGAPLASAQTTPPSVAELCAASGVEQVDAALQGLADTDLVGELAPLLDITVPREDGLTLDVELDRFRTALDCDALTPPTTDPVPTTDAPVPPLYPDCAAARAAGAAPVILGDPGYRPELDSDGDGIGCEDGEGPTSPVDDGDADDVGTAPSRSAATGGTYSS